MTPLSAPDWCFLKPDIDPATHYTRLKALGYDAVEMVAPENWASARNAGLDIVNLSAPGMQRGLNCRAHHPELLGQIRRCIADAAANDIGHVIVFSGNRSNGQSDVEGQAACVEALRILAPVAAGSGVTLLLEMLNSFDHLDYQADRSAYGFGVVEAVDSPAVKVLYDVYHMARMGEDPVADICANLRWIAHLHFAEMPMRTVPLADGGIACRDLVRRVIAAGYRGSAGMEFLPTGDVYAELEQARALLDSVAGYDSLAQGDGIADRGAKFAS